MKTSTHIASNKLKKETSAVTSNMTLEQASEYLKSLGEWWAVRNCPRETMIKWANYLKEHGATK